MNDLLSCPPKDKSFDLPETMFELISMKNCMQDSAISNKNPDTDFISAEAKLFTLQIRNTGEESERDREREREILDVNMIYPKRC